MIDPGLRKPGAALLSVHDKAGLPALAEALAAAGVRLYATGGTLAALRGAGYPAIDAAELTGAGAMLGGRVKTLHPAIFAGLLARRDDPDHLAQLQAAGYPPIDLAVVALYPFYETVAGGASEAEIVEQIDIGGVALLRAAAKNYADVAVLHSPAQYEAFLEDFRRNGGQTTREQRRRLAAAAFDYVAAYDDAIADHFNGRPVVAPARRALRYGENPHQAAVFRGDLDTALRQISGKELSYNNLVDVDAALGCAFDFPPATFVVVKHANPCGIATRDTPAAAWREALACDPESAFGGVLAVNVPLDEATAAAIGDLYFDVLLAPEYTEPALALLAARKKRTLLTYTDAARRTVCERRVLNGRLWQREDDAPTEPEAWRWTTERAAEGRALEDLAFAERAVKHLKSNAIAIVKDRRLIGAGMGQPSRVGAARQAFEKARANGFDTRGAVLASDAFLPFDDVARLAEAAGITAIVQPGGSVRDADTIAFCAAHGIALAFTDLRRFRH